MSEKFEPKGVKFWDKAQQRWMMLCQEGEFNNWILYQHPDGQWVSLREADLNDMISLEDLIDQQEMAMPIYFSFKI